MGNEQNKKFQNILKKGEMKMRVSDMITKVLYDVKKALSGEPISWKTREKAERMILEGFREYGIPESEYMPYMSNNVLPTILLK